VLRIGREKLAAVKGHTVLAPFSGYTGSHQLIGRRAPEYQVFAMVGGRHRRCRSQVLALGRGTQRGTSKYVRSGSQPTPLGIAGSSRLHSGDG